MVKRRVVDDILASRLRAAKCLPIGPGKDKLVLQVFVVKAVYRFSWLQACVSVFALPIIAVDLSVCCIITLALTGEGVNDVFQNVVDNLGTPAP